MWLEQEFKNRSRRDGAGPDRSLVGHVKLFYFVQSEMGIIGMLLTGV